MAYRTARKVVTFDDVDPTIIRQRRNTRSQSPSKKTLQNQSSTASRPSNSPSPSKAPSQTGSGMTSKSTSSLSTGQSSAKSRSDNVSRSTRSQSPTKAFHNAVSETFKRKAKTPSPTKSGLSKKPRTTANMDIRRPEIIPWDFTSQSKASTGVSSHSNLASDGAASSNIIYSPAVEPSDEGDRYGSRSPESENSQNQLDQDTPDFDAEDQDDIDQDIHDLDDDNQDQDGDSNQEVDSFRQQRSPNVSAYSKEKSSNLHQGPQADTNKGDPRDKSPREHHQQAKHVRQSLADFKKALEQVAKPPGIHFVRSSTPRGTDNLRHRRSQSKDGKITQLQIASLEKTMEALDDLDNHFGERLKSLEEAESITVIAESGKSATEPQTARADPSQPERTLGEEYIPVRFAYPQHPQGEQSDDWWVRSVRELFDKVMSCAEKHYGQVDIKVDINKEDGSYWANAQATPELENYVSMVAEADPRNGGWDRLITEKSQRAYLITGIIAKVLEAKVFDPLLFGAEKSQVEFLEELEKKFIDNEGYERTALRASTIRTMLDSHPVTPLFSHSVLSLSHQLFELLLPFDHAQRDERIRSQANNRHSFAEGVHVLEPHVCLQDIHDIVGMAAYLSICIRLSTSIIFIRSEVPGNKYEQEDQLNMDHGLYLSSKAGWERYKMKKKSGSNDEEKARLDKERYSPRIKIALWPSFKRYSPGDGKPGGERNGFRIYDISKSRVVYYWAAANRSSKDNVGLRKTVAKGKSQREMFGWVRRKLSWYMGH